MFFIRSKVHLNLRKKSVIRLWLPVKKSEEKKERSKELKPGVAYFQTFLMYTGPSVESEHSYLKYTILYEKQQNNNFL